VGKVKELLGLLGTKRTLLIVMQDNPDPDSIASAAALRRLARTAGDVLCSIAYGGVIGRSENRALADYLGLNFRPIADVDPTRFDAIALVDTQPRTGNNSLPDTLVPDIVLDHHPLLPTTRDIAFADVRSNYGALSTMMLEYLVEAEIAPGAPLATALLYAIRTDTQDLGRNAIQADAKAIETLFPLANGRMLGEIQQGAVGVSYFKTLAHALDEASVLGRCVFAILGTVDNPDMVAELADLFRRSDQADWSLCSGVCLGKVWVSLRTSGPDLDAAAIARRLIDGLGTGGGHGMFAAAQIPLEAGTKAEQTRILRELRARLLREIGEPGRRPKRLLGPRKAG